MMDPIYGRVSRVRGRGKLEVQLFSTDKLMMDHPSDPTLDIVNEDLYEVRLGPLKYAQKVIYL